MQSRKRVEDVADRVDDGRCLTFVETADQSLATPKVTGVSPNFAFRSLKDPLDIVVAVDHSAGGIDLNDNACVVRITLAVRSRCPWLGKRDCM